MTVESSEEPRQPLRRPPLRDAADKDTLLNFLNFNREAVILKLEGLDDRDAHRALVPSGTSLVGLVKHLTDCETFWFASRFAGQPRTDPAETSEMSTAALIAAYRTAIDASNAITDAAGSLETRAARAVGGESLTLECILTHMISETARHAGHADIIRELIDGAVGL